ncbi:hypothetical protein Gasu2_68640 [Galdieria sulphuraria]|nr:hypothetical protein Gasu2_68640 [Galdieria sulphuraria]
MPGVHDKSIQRMTAGNTPKLSHCMDLNLSKVPIVEGSSAEKRKADFQQKTAFQYSPVSPCCQSLPSVPAYSLPSVASELNCFHQEQKVSIGNLVDSSTSPTGNETDSQFLKDEFSCQMLSNLPRSCKLARATPYRRNELCEMTHLTFPHHLKSEMYSYFFSRPLRWQETSSVVSPEKDLKKDTSSIPIKVCSNCSTTVSPNWYLAEDKRPLCNACGKFWKRTGTHRPSCHWGRKIKKRASCNGNRSKRRHKYENIKESLNATFRSHSSIWGNATKGMGDETEFGTIGSSCDSSPFERNKGAEGHNHYCPMFGISSEAKDGGDNNIIPISREHKFEVKHSASPVQACESEEILTFSTRLQKRDDEANGSKTVIESDVGSSTSFSTKETDCNSLLHEYAQYSTFPYLSSTSRKSQLFALDDTFTKHSLDRAAWNSKSLIEILALAASKALETADPQLN